MAGHPEQQDGGHGQREQLQEQILAEHPAPPDEARLAQAHPCRAEPFAAEASEAVQPRLLGRAARGQQRVEVAGLALEGRQAAPPLEEPPAAVQAQQESRDPGQRERQRHPRLEECQQHQHAAEGDGAPQQLKEGVEDPDGTRHRLRLDQVQSFLLADILEEGQVDLQQLGVQQAMDTVADRQGMLLGHPGEESPQDGQGRDHDGAGDEPERHGAAGRLAQQVEAQAGQPPRRRR